MRRALAAWALVVCAACDDGGAAPPRDAAPVDAGAVDAAVDLGGVDARGDDAAPAARLDAAAVDAAVDAAADPMADAAPDAMADAAPPFEPVELPLDAPRRLAPDAPLAFDLELDRPAALQLDVVLWRVEEGRLRITWQGATADAQVLGDGAGGLRAVTVPLRARGSADPRPPGALRLRPGAGTLRVAVAAGGLVVRGARLVGLDAVDPPPPPAPPAAEGEVVLAAPCAEAGCDDAAALGALVEAAPPGPLVLRLAEGTYTLRSPLVVRRDDVAIVGDGVVVLRWAPTVDAQAAVTFAGGGPAGPPVSVGAVTAGQRVFVVNAPDGWAPAFVRIEADDFGPVPAPCLNGRDVERANRHLGQWARVEGLRATSAGLEVTVDRGMQLDVPADANPRLQGGALLAGARIEGVVLEADCPAAADDQRFRRADCATPAVGEDDGVALRYTVGARVVDVRLRWFGRFAVRVDNALETFVDGGGMDHPADFGEGGRGYGVHTIRATRTRVHGFDVEHARHGVVIDFGSAETQVVGCDLRDMNQALVDVHGEASRDTLVWGNTLADAPSGVLVGGGGVDVHCNDGPRHHVLFNDIRDTPLASVGLLKAAREVDVIGNTLGVALNHVNVALGSGDVRVHRNRLQGARSASVLVISGEVPAGPVSVTDNLFVDACRADRAFSGQLGAVIDSAGNALCPE
ncbi:MAG: hypothetical protein H6704_22810 [Myxococcales bacterium]|nr:hypothetical protein [Myxococcales bacterium]